MRRFVKALAFGLATAIVFPELISYWLRASFVGRDRALQGSSEILALLPGLFGEYLRRAFYTRTLERYHPSATIAFGTLFSKAGACIEENVYVGPRCHLGLVHLEGNVLLAAGVHVTSGAQTHGTDDLSTPIREQPGTARKVRVGTGTWIGSAAVVMADVGRDTVVGAGAVVTRPLPDRVVAAGVPARVLRHRDRSAPPAPDECVSGKPAVLANCCVEGSHDVTR